jgi:ElaB/YqjD/DUF883 family membrane-anchored ribosome-binding protein
MQQKPDPRPESLVDRLHHVAPERLQDTGDRARQIVSGVTEQARYYGEQAQDAARQFKPFVERSLKEQPITTLAGAVVIGFLLGAIWKK